MLVFVCGWEVKTRVGVNGFGSVKSANLPDYTKIWRDHELCVILWIFSSETTC